MLPLDPVPVEPGIDEWPLVNGAVLRIELLPKGELPDVDPNAFEIYVWINSPRFGAFLDRAELPEAPQITKRLHRRLKRPRDTGCLFLGQVSARRDTGGARLESFAASDGTLRKANFDARGTISDLVAQTEPAAFFDTLHLGFWTQTLAALDTLWTFVFLGLDAGFPPGEIARRAADPRYGRTTQAWRTTGSLEEPHIEALARAWTPAELPR